MPADAAMAGWPPLPYKGLTYYTAEDEVLFAGRHDDIIRCGMLMAEQQLRVMLLHGATGCGKSSFLRAGLIPYLERSPAGIAFARAGGPVLFVRSTADPLRSLADSIYIFADRKITRLAPDGELSTLRLRDALPVVKDAEEFRRLCGDDPDALLEVLEKLSRIVPQTLALIIDQGEEVLTVDLTEEGERCRKRFFEFVTDFGLAPIDMKVLVALRTEYVGRFISRMCHRLPAMDWYYLDTLTNEQVTEAILRPTSDKPIGDLGAPRNHYGFRFKGGVVGTIISELGNAGSKLPAVQIVCTSLYETALKRGKPATITAADLRALGGVEGSIGAFIDQQIRSYCDKLRLLPGEADQELVLWKMAMYGLTRPQADGSVTTDLKPTSDFVKELAGSKLDVEDAIAHFKAPDLQLLRVVEVVQAGTGKLIPCVGLGHDSLGLVLQKWKLSVEQQPKETRFRSDDLAGFDELRAADGIALCLSGGGYRAMLFHLGALWRLNELGYLPKLDRISAVSSGAILAGHVALHWKDLTFDAGGLATNFAKEIVTPIRGMAQQTLDGPSLIFGLLSPAKGALNLARSLQRWFKNSTLQDWSDRPRVVVSATNLQCGSLFLFTKPYLADHRLGRIINPKITVAHAVAAAAATSPVLSPMILKFRADEWSDPTPLDPQFRSEVHLTDGAIYDFYALESAWKRHRTILVSDGGVGGRRKDDPSPSRNLMSQTARAFELTTESIRGLRKRQVIEAFVNRQREGTYWSIGSRMEDYPVRGIPEGSTWMGELDSLPTRYAQLDDETQQRLINWGYAICDAAMRSHMGAEARFALPYG